MEKKWDPSLWKPVGFKQVEVKDCSVPGEKSLSWIIKHLRIDMKFVV